MLEPASMMTTIAMAFSSIGVVLAVTSPAAWAPDVAAIFVGFIGALVWQGYTKEQRKPTSTVMMADLVAGTFFGFVSKVIGVPFCVGFINRFLPTDAQLQFSATDDIRWVVIFAAIAGVSGAPLVRFLLDRYVPGWNEINGRKN